MTAPGRAGLAVLAALLAALPGCPQRTAGLEEAGRQAEALLAQARDLLARHPDYLFPEAGRLEAWAALSPRQRGGGLEEIRELCAGLESSAVARATGRLPGSEGWAELLRWKTFSPNGFRDLYEALTPAPAAAAPPVTGQAAADGRIARLALARGYRLRPQADAALLADAGAGRLLEPQVLQAFRGLQAAAVADGLALELVSGWRSVSRQRDIFLGALAERGRRDLGRAYTAGEIASGQADAALEAVLAESAPPGYSRHHTGRALDLNDPSSGRPFTEFGSSGAFRWLAADNYLAAKRFGFIPSYPPGAAAQGPDPEPWELVWVGEAALASAHLH